MLLVDTIALVIIAACQMWRVFSPTVMRTTIHSINVKDPDRWMKDLLAKQAPSARKDEP